MKSSLFGPIVKRAGQLQSSSHMMVPEPTPFVFNCSRVGRQGGLRTFANEMMQAALDDGFSCRAVVPAGYCVPEGVEAVFAPASLAGNSNLSLFRPVKWFAYSCFSFPISRNQRVLCTTHHVLPGRSRQIATVHDLRPYFLPDTPVQSFYFRHMLPRALRRCDGVLTVSETSRQTIAEIYDIPLDRIAVVPNSIQPAPLLPMPSSAERYLLAVGASWSHKNIESVLAQHDLWSKEYVLKIVAGRGPYLCQLENLALTLGIAARTEFLTDVTSDTLEQLYAGCSALVYPSRMEGFGLPPLEAMARGRPAIVADLPVFHELYGAHALYVQPENAASWQKAFVALSSVDSADMEAARLHANTYTRQRMATALREALRRFWSL